MNKEYPAKVVWKVSLVLLELLDQLVALDLLDLKDPLG